MAVARKYPGERVIPNTIAFSGKNSTGACIILGSSSQTLKTFAEHDFDMLKYFFAVDFPGPNLKELTKLYEKLSADSSS